MPILQRGQEAEFRLASAGYVSINATGGGIAEIAIPAGLPGGPLRRVADEASTFQDIPAGTALTVSCVYGVIGYAVDAAAPSPGGSGAVTAAAMVTALTGAPELPQIQALVSGYGIEVVPTAQTYGAIMDAVNKVIANGGGIVRLKPDGYDITSAGQGLPIVSNVTYEGAGYLTNTGNNLAGGTIIYSTSKAFNIFEANTADRVSDVATLAELRADVVYGFHLRSLGIKGGLNGIKVGAKHRGGAYNSSIDLIQIDDCAEWGGWIENWQYSEITRLKIQPSSTQRGCAWIGASTGEQLFNHGNLRIANIFGEGGGTRTRGLVFMARGSNTKLNDVNVSKLQRNAQGAKLSVAATMANTSADITVADASLFPVDLPVTVSATANGFTRFQTYFVVYSSGSTIRLANFVGGTAIASTGNTAVNIVTWGWAPLEIVGYGPLAGGNTIQPSNFSGGIDLEGFATAMVIAQNAALKLDIGTCFYQQDTNLASTIVARQISGKWSSVSPAIPDFDANSAGQCWSDGYTLANDASEIVPGSIPQGGVRGTKTNHNGIQFGISTANPDPMKGINASGEAWVYPGHSIGQRQVMPISSTGNRNLNGADLGCLQYVGTGNVTWTLPTLSGSTSGAVNSYIGSVYEIANCSTSAVSITLNTAAGQPINRQPGKTSLTIAQGQSISLRACTNAGADWFWQVIGNNGVVI